MNYWTCRVCGRGMQTLTSGERWHGLCPTCDPRSEDERRRYARAWFDERYPPERRDLTRERLAQIRSYAA